MINRVPESKAGPKPQNTQTQPWKVHKHTKVHKQTHYEPYTTHYTVYLNDAHSTSVMRGLHWTMSSVIRGDTRETWTNESTAGEA